jgi:hypothetical protein
MVSPMGVTNSQYLFITDGTGFFQMEYVPSKRDLRRPRLQQIVPDLLISRP